MKRWTLLLTALILSGCAGTQVQIPDWTIAEREPTEVTDPQALPLLCPIPWTSVECWAAIEQYEIVAESNTTIAQANATALRNTEAAYDHLVNAGKLQQQFTQLREEQLAEERKQHEATRWTYRVIIGLGLVAVAL